MVVFSSYFIFSEIEECGEHYSAHPKSFSFYYKSKQRYASLSNQIDFASPQTKLCSCLSQNMPKKYRKATIGNVRSFNSSQLILNMYFSMAMYALSFNLFHQAACFFNTNSQHSLLAL